MGVYMYQRVPKIFIDFLLVGGGGGGAWSGGGGGGGGLQEQLGYELEEGTYSVTIGAGGAGGDYYGTSWNGLAGGSSSFNDINVNGGGGGNRSGGGGGSGGGTGNGGGWGGTGHGGAGGDGAQSTITGQRYGGGGGGGSSKGYNVSGGQGGGGMGGMWGGGATYYGGGGGGGGDSKAKTSGDGYAGIFVLRYIAEEGCTITGGTITTEGDYTIHTFTSSGTLTVSFS